MPTETIDYFDRDGLQLAVHVRSGHGVPILCIPGLTRNHRDFDDLLAQFPDRPIYRMDLRGRGASDWDPEPQRYTPEIYVADLLEWLAQQDQVFDFVGTSLGGILTMAVASVRPECIRRAVINDIGPVIDRQGMRKIRNSGDRTMCFADWATATEAVKVAQLPMHPRVLDWLAVAKRLCRQTDQGVCFDFDPAIFEQVSDKAIEPFWPLWHALADKPTLLVHGETSTLLTQGVVNDMLASHPKVSYLPVPETGHAPTLSEHECVAALHDFLA